MAKRILFIHGRAPKPDKNDLQTLWFDAIQHGLLRDYGESRVQAFKQIEKRFIYYGDLSNELLEAPTEDPQSRIDALKNSSNTHAMASPKRTTRRSQKRVS